MTQEERYGTRDTLTYSAWHRRQSTARFVSHEDANRLGMIDVDVALYVEYETGGKTPLVLIETARDVGQDWKCATVLEQLARLANIPALCVLYIVDDTPNPASPSANDIKGFRVRRLFPVSDSGFFYYTPQEYAQLLVKIRNDEDVKIRRLIQHLFDCQPTRPITMCDGGGQ